jgi:malonyl-CoA O-methyltransferase
MAGVGARGTARAQLCQYQAAQGKQVHHIGECSLTGADPGLPARDAYRLWAATYDAENAVTWLEQRTVLQLTPPLAGTWLLDAACGTGRRLPAAGASGPQCVVGVDLVLEMIAQSSPKRAHAQDAPALLAVADVRWLPCRADLFHVIWCRLAAGHLPELDSLYAELARVARAGAHIIVSDFHPAAARRGHTRTFKDAHGQLHTVEHFIHEVAAHARAAARAGLALTAQHEGRVGPEVRSFYEAAGRGRAYVQQEGLPLVLALAFRA